MSTTKKNGVPIWLNLLFGLLIIGAGALLVLLFTNTTPSYEASKPSDLTPDFSEVTPNTVSPWDTRQIEEKIYLSGNAQTQSSATQDNTSFVFEDSNSRYLTESELYGMSDWDLRVARNEIYARHGRIFEDEALREHFESQTWYEPLYTADEMDALGQSIFNDFEIYNLDLITQVETALGYR